MCCEEYTGLLNRKGTRRNQMLAGNGDKQRIIFLYLVAFFYNNSWFIGFPSTDDFQNKISRPHTKLSHITTDLTLSHGVSHTLKTSHKCTIVRQLNHYKVYMLMQPFLVDDSAFIKNLFSPQGVYQLHNLGYTTGNYLEKFMLNCLYHLDVTFLHSPRLKRRTRKLILKICLRKNSLL